MPFHDKCSFYNACSLENVNNIVECYKKNGYVLIQLLTPEECRANVLEQWEKIILCQPWKQDMVLEKKDYDQNLPFNENENEAFLNYVTKLSN